MEELNALTVTNLLLVSQRREFIKNTTLWEKTP